ncbi:hypothetical protein GGQ74_000824 [Desulfobaculum xiamenense]|uniref:Uncharacterized protein n=1 Tax=Desulfobaculum xiamenense TaxID=995050 RepID=A0A846QPP3_9BACT|nr:hypothetical protein [Desulfobaculum xiamenense]NJB67184.1 hypothetical protein [Desulfobaculum xiamenense]
MGKILQIRVSAGTPYPDDVKRAWPRLFSLAWPETKTPVAPGGGPCGVMELVLALDDQVRFGIKDKKLTAALREDLDRALALKERLEAALGDWKPGDANALSVELEDALDTLERIAPQP